MNPGMLAHALGMPPDTTTVVHCYKTPHRNDTYCGKEADPPPYNDPGPFTQCPECERALRARHAK